MDKLFSGLKIIELASVLAGPLAGTFFAELGAEVIKVEHKDGGGDMTRHWRQENETKDGPSAYYASANWGKSVRMMNFDDPDDRPKLTELISSADIVITNFKPGDDEKFGLRYEDVVNMQPSVIYGRITGYGPESDRVAYDLILQAESGFMSINGQPNDPPTKLPLALIDVLAAHQLKEGLLCALLRKQKDEEQSFFVEVSLYDSAVASLINQATNWLMNENEPQKLGSLHPNIAPYGEIFTTADDEMITLAIGNDRQFKKLCAYLKLPEIVENDHFKTNQQRVKNREELTSKLQASILTHQSETLLSELGSLSVPAGAIRSIPQVFERKEAKNLLLRETVDGRHTVRPRSTVFQIRS